MIIQKFVFSHSTLSTFNLPPDAPILTVQLQDDDIVLWALIDKRKKRVSRHFVLIYDDMETIENEDDLIYLNTVQNRRTTYHIFELVEN